MAGDIIYNKDLFDFVSNLTAINNSIAFERVGDRVVVRKSDKNKTLPYILSVPAEYFDIEDTVAFYKYDHFYKFMSTLKRPNLKIKEDRMIMSGKGIRVNYMLSDPEGIINGPKTVEFDNWNIRFTLTKEDLDEIVKINTLVKGTKARIRCEDNSILITIYSSGSDNSFEKEFEAERLTDNDDTFEFTILSNRFEFLPSKRDYSIDISQEKFMRMSLIHEEIEFDMYSGEVR